MNTIYYVNRAIFPLSFGCFVGGVIFSVIISTHILFGRGTDPNLLYHSITDKLSESPNMDYCIFYGGYKTISDWIDVYNSKRERIKHNKKTISTTIQIDSLPELILFPAQYRFKDEYKSICFSFIEEMPRFPGCEGITGARKEKEDCANRKLMNYVYKHIKYPALARESSIQGTVIISFIVKSNGQMENPYIVRDIGGGGCGAEALRIFKKMKASGLKWIPGRNRGMAVNFRYNFPIRFKLD